MLKLSFRAALEAKGRSLTRTWLSKESASALIVFSFGLAVIMGSLQYRMGSLRQIGPGLYPLILGILLVVLSVALLAGAGSSRERIPVPYLKEAFFIFGGIVVFALTVSRFGLFPSVILSTFVLSFAQRRSGLLEIAGISLGLLAITSVLFIYLLGMNIPFLRW